MTVQTVEAFSPYSTATAAFAALPQWMDEYDAARVNSYQLYEQIYWNVPNTFVLTQRGSDGSPIYVPTARTIVDATARFLCPSPGITVDPLIGDPVGQQSALTAFQALFRREKFWSKFAANKRFGIIRGDWCFHILGNPTKAQGTRIKIETVDPAAYFPVTHPDDPDKIIAVHIVEQVEDDEGNFFIRRQTYQRGADPLNNDGSDTTIYNSIGLFDMEQWSALTDKAVTILKPPTPLPPAITAIPVYHIKNIESPGDPFGSSELRGFERIMAAVNQAISDEELALALEGLGMYATDGGPPRDDAGNVTDWILGPGRVVEHAQGSKFQRVNGVSSVDPVQSHLKFLIDQLKQASSTPDIATGMVDVSIAQSGVALALQLGPMLSKVGERQESVNDTMMQMLFDMNSWFTAYEAQTFNAQVVPTFGNAIPDDVDAEFTRIMTLLTNNVVDANWARTELAKLGYDFGGLTTDGVAADKAKITNAADPFANRTVDELGQ